MIRVPSPRLHVGRRRLTFLSSAAAVVFAAVAFATPSFVQGASMETTLRPGDLLLVDRTSPMVGIERGQIVIFNPPLNSPEPFIKRVIGLPGETVAIHGGHVYVNGALLPEPYLARGETTTTNLDRFEVTVPANAVFVLGDNRTASWDSRAYGTVPISRIIGRAWLAFDPSILIAVL